MSTLRMGVMGRLDQLRDVIAAHDRAPLAPHRLAGRTNQGG
ncbi:hypothetical protein [Kocuria rosea]|nr:hypothetical protein [Kocuria rosea]